MRANMLSDFSLRAPHEDETKSVPQSHKNDTTLHILYYFLTYSVKFL